MPLTSFQQHVLRLLAAQRTPESYVAGGAPIAAKTERISKDFDIFNDRVEIVASAAQADEMVLLKHGLKIEWEYQREGMWRGHVIGGEHPLKLEWAHDSAYRFFPAQRDPDFGFVLHPADLATNKVLALAGRKVVRDVVDLVALDEHVPIAAAIIAAPAKDPGYTPESLVNALQRSSAHPQAAFDAMASTAPIDGGGILRTLRERLTQAAATLEGFPDDAIGRFYTAQDKIVVPASKQLASYSVIEARLHTPVPQVEGMSAAVLAARYKGQRGL